MDEKTRAGMYFIQALGLVDGLANHIKELKQRVEEGEGKEFAASVISIENRAARLGMDVKLLFDNLPKK